MQEALSTLFRRDLTRLYQEIEAYPSEEAVWVVADGISNSAGNLALHLVGNLRAYVGATLGNINYLRDREAEFSRKDVPRRTLLDQIADTRSVVETTIRALTNEQLQASYPADVLGFPMTTAFFLIHLHGHLNYHLGQVDYHRRLLTGGKRVEFVP
jgi:uncharacterized damage-inducible protein DinB